MMLSYRRDEIEDLIQTISKKLDESPDQLAAKPNEKQNAIYAANRDKLQDELNTIEEQLFELEKKYGEVQTRRLKK